MTKLFPLFFICLFSTIIPYHLQAYQSAHVIMISHYGFDQNQQPKRYVLFGLTKKGQLSTFGGLRDRGESNPKDTAAREAEEEGLGVLGNRKAIRNSLRGVQPSSGTKSGHMSYVLPGKYYGNHISQRFKEIRFDKKRKLSHSQKEMVDIVAVRVETIRQQVLKGGPLKFKDNKGNLRSLRPGVEGAIKAAVKAGHI